MTTTIVKSASIAGAMLESVPVKAARVVEDARIGAARSGRETIVALRGIHRPEPAGRAARAARAVKILVAEREAQAATGAHPVA
jgi:hypothetical protein